VVVAQARMFALAIDARQRVVAAFVVEVKAMPAVEINGVESMTLTPLIPF